MSSPETRGGGKRALLAVGADAASLKFASVLSSGVLALGFSPPPLVGTAQGGMLRNLECTAGSRRGPGVAGWPLYRGGGMASIKRVHPPIALRSYVASTFGMISSFSRLRSLSVFETGTSWNGGQMSSIVSPASFNRLRLSVICAVVPTSRLVAFPRGV